MIALKLQKTPLNKERSLNRERSMVKKIIYANILLALIAGASKTTQAEMPSSFEHEQPISEPEETIKEKTAEKQKLEQQKQGEINNLNRLFGRLKGKGAKDTAALNAEIQKITGSNVSLDPNSKNFQEEKKQLQQATIDKYNEKINKISEQIKVAQEATDTVANDFDKGFSDNDFSDNGLSDNEGSSLSQTEINNMIKTYKEMSVDFEQALTEPDVLIDQLDNNQRFLNEVDHLATPSTRDLADLKNFLKSSPASEGLINKAKKDADIISAINQVKTSLENIAENPNDQTAFIDRNDAVRNLEKLTGITIAGNKGIVDSLSDLNSSNLEDVYQKVADSYKSSQREESLNVKTNSKPETINLSKTEMAANKLALRKATSIVEDLTSSSLLSDKEANNLDQKANTAKDALSEGIGSKIIKAMNDLIASLRALLDELLSNTRNPKTTVSQKKQVTELQNQLKNLSANLKSK